VGSGLPARRGLPPGDETRTDVAIAIRSSAVRNDWTSFGKRLRVSESESFPMPAKYHFTTDHADGQALARNSNYIEKRTSVGMRAIPSRAIAGQWPCNFQ